MALAAIQGLNEEKDEEIAGLRAEMERRIVQLRPLLVSLLAHSVQLL